MRKLGKSEHAAKVTALCLPPVMMSLIGVAALSRKRDDAVVAGLKTSPGLRSKRPLRGRS